MRIIDVSRKDSSGNETSINKLSLEEYEALPNKSTQGTPVSFYYEPKRLVGALYLWNAPNSDFATNHTVEIVYQAPMEDMDVGTEDVDFPNEWYDALILNLAVRLAPRYGMDRKEQELLQTQANMALATATMFDTEDGSIYLQPDYKGMR